MNSKKSIRRKSYTETGKLYFFTATINQWERLFELERNKEIVIECLQHLSNTNKIRVYGFVIMPTHLHIIWQILGSNNKESPQTTFLKFTAHAFLKTIKDKKKQLLRNYRVSANNKRYEFWQRDSLAFELKIRKTALTKLNYIHNNPIAKHWRLASSPEEYKYSSAQFYKNGENNFSFLKHIMEVI